jgi:FKBP-type peptidyl-prolyl cis-trans isomerase FklB
MSDSPTKKESNAPRHLTAIVLMALGGYLIFNFIFDDMFPTQEQKQARAEAAKAIITQSENFLSENAQQDGIEVTQSGLQYRVVEPGSGAQPGPRDRVVVNYTGKLVDGTIFDSSYARGEPLSIPVHRVIPGWTEALQLMKVGAKWQLFIPASLGYGIEGAGDLIPPHAALIFDVELVSIEK